MPSAEPRGHPKQGAVTPRRRAVGKTRLSPSQGPYRRPTSLLPMPVRRSGPGLTSQPAPASDGCRPSDTQPHVACMGVETIASRAVTSLYLLIRRYSKRHGLHRPREVGRRAAGRCASGGRARARGWYGLAYQEGKGVKSVKFLQYEHVRRGDVIGDDPVPRWSACIRLLPVWH